VADETKHDTLQRAEEEEEIWEGTPTLFEGARPLSKSLLWRINREYYESVGIDAWSHGDVPFTLTSGPIVAWRYARVIEGFVRDCLAGRFGPVDAGEPLYVVELGAGSGRLGFMLMQMIDHALLEPMKLVYVLTDMVEANVEFCKERKELRRWVDAGRMDFARYEAGTDQPIHLEHAGIDLAPDKVANPVVGIANYLFCASPQDLFSVIGDDLYEEHVAIFTVDPDIPPSAGAEFLKQPWLATAHAPVQGDRFGGGRLDRILRAKAAALRGGKERFLFQPLAINSMDALLNISGNRLCILVGDRSPEPLATVDDDEGPSSRSTAYTPAGLLSMGIHGSSISVPVDTEVLEIAARDAGADLIVEANSPGHLLICAIVAGEQQPALELRTEFRRAFGQTAADDLLITVGRATTSQTSTVDSIFATIRVSGYDPFTFVRVYPTLEKLLEKSTRIERDELERIAQRIYALNYPLEEISDLAFGLAQALVGAGRFEAALEFFLHSRDDRPPGLQALHNAALCCLHLGRRDEALAYLNEALAADPDYELALEMREQLLAGEGLEGEEDGEPSTIARVITAGRIGQPLPEDAERIIIRAPGLEA
jgi:tetratricopeptide (TPR) repeat protein